MTNTTFESPEYESIAPSTPSERFLLARMEALEAKVGELGALTTTQAETIVAQAEEIADLREEVARERAFDRRRISSLEGEDRTHKTVTSSPKASEHIETLFDLMLQSGLKQVSVSTAAKMLGISRVHMHRLKATLGSDRRFVVVQDPHHKQRHLIRLT